MARLWITISFFVIFLVACEAQSDGKGIETVDVSAPQNASPNVHRITQGTQLIRGDLRIGVVRVSSDAVILAIIVGSAKAETVEVKVGDEIVRGKYHISNLGTNKDYFVLPWSPPGSDKSYVRLEIKTANVARKNIGAMLAKLAMNRSKSLDEAGLFTVFQQVDDADDILGIQKIEIMTGVRKRLDINESDEWIVGTDSRNGRMLKVAYYCEDVCPKNGNIVLVYDSVSRDDCATLRGIPLKSMFGDFIGCKPDKSLVKNS